MKKRHVVLAALIITFATGAGTAVWAYTCSDQTCMPDQGPFGGVFICVLDPLIGTDCRLSEGGSLCATLTCAPPVKSDPPNGQWVIRYDDGGCDVWNPYEAYYEYQLFREVHQRSGPN